MDKLTETVEIARRAVKRAQYAFMYGGWDAHDRATAQRLTEIREELRQMRDKQLARVSQRLVAQVYRK